MKTISAELSVSYLATNWTSITSLHPFINTTKMKMVTAFSYNFRIVGGIFCIVKSIVMDRSKNVQTPKINCYVFRLSYRNTNLPDK